MSQQYGRNILLYRLYTIFNEPLFWGPVLIASLQNLAHMSLPAIYFQESLVLCICLILDVPAGALADLVGRRRVIIAGRAFLFLDVFLFATMKSPTDALLANILWAVGFSLQSGADEALIPSPTDY